MTIQNCIAKLKLATALCALCALMACSPSKNEPSERQMAMALQDLLEQSAAAAAKEANIADYAPFVDKLVSFSKAACAPEPEPGIYLCSFQATISAKIPGNNNSVEERSLSGAYRGRFLNRDSNWYLLEYGN